MSLARLFEGLVATLRADVIPNVADPYARGQAIGVIDLINNIAGRIEWARAPLLAAVRAKQILLAAVAERLNERAADAIERLDSINSAELSAERARLDAEICAAMQRAHARGGESGAHEALRLMIRHAHDEASEQMKTTRKPLFGEIASGVEEKPARRAT